MPYVYHLEGPFIPYVRMTQRGKFVHSRAQEYLAELERLGWALRGQMEHNRWARLPERTPLTVTIRFDHINRRADLDNLAKAVLDACNKIVWPDDRWIDALTVSRSDLRPPRASTRGSEETKHGYARLEVAIR